MRAWSASSSALPTSRTIHHDNEEEHTMGVRRPNLAQLRSVAEDLGMHMGEEELKSYNELLQGNFAAYDVVDAMADYLPPVKYPRMPGYRPEGEENKYNAWYVKTTIKGAASGKLSGKTVALKDNKFPPRGGARQCEQRAR